MGTWVRIVGDKAEVGIIEIKRLDKLLSKFDSNSEISLMNKGQGPACRSGRVKGSRDTREVLELAEEVKRLSHGAFDITMGKGRQIDLGGIAKGYAVGKAREKMRLAGVKRAMIDMHSSIAVIGDGWRVGVSGIGNQILEVVELNDGEALSTSGQYEQPGHILDPRTGKPADKCLSVTVIAKDAGLADALSTAVFVLGPVEGMKLIKSIKNVKVIILDRKGKIYANFGSKLR